MSCVKQKTREYIESKLSPLSEVGKIHEAVKFCSHLYETENERKSIIEGKANTLIASVGVATAFIVGFLGLMSRVGSNSNWPLLLLIGFTYLLIVIHLLLCVFYALRAVKVTKYRYSMPDPEDIYLLERKSVTEVKKERAVDYLFSYFRNRDLNDEKATNLDKAQQKLKICIVLLAILPLLFCLNLWDRDNGNSSNTQRSQISSTYVKAEKAGDLKRDNSFIKAVSERGRSSFSFLR